MLDPYHFDAASHKRALDAAGIGATCVLTLTRDSHMPDHPEAARRFLLKAMDNMAVLESTYLAGCIAYNLGTLTGAPPTARERQTIIATMKLVAADAADRGIALALEVCNRYETHLYNTLADGRDTILAVGADNFKLHADTYHMNIEEESFYDALVNAADVLDYIHMSESHRGLVGSGTVKWDEVWRGLAAAGYQGSLVLESFAAVNPALAAATCIWRAPNRPSEVLAREGLVFLKAGAARYSL
jgi:D-psicose/D-tagatose/L-ribulose 3-epimerase